MQVDEFFSPHDEAGIKTRAETSRIRCRGSHRDMVPELWLTFKAGDLQGMTISLPKHRYAGLDESNAYGLPATLSKSTDGPDTTKLGNTYYNSGTLVHEQQNTGQQTTSDAQGFYYKGTLKQTEPEENPASQIQSTTGELVLSEEEKVLEKSYLWKADIRIVPLFGFLYLMAVMTRSNIGAAKVAGLEEALGLTPTDFANATSFFYLGYILFQIPSNMMLKLVSPARWFPIIVIAWSVVCMCVAAVTNSAGLIALRFLIGVTQAGFTPGVIFYLTFWYTRSEQGLRNSLFFSAGTVASVFGGPIAGALASANIGNLAPWQSIFLIEGAISCFFGVLALFLLANYPETASFLTDDEKVVCRKKLSAEQALASDAKMSWKQIGDAFATMHMWLFGVCFWAVNVGTVSLGVFSPVLIKDLGFSGTQALYLSCLPNFCGLVGQLSTGYLMGRFPFWLLETVCAVVTVVMVLLLMLLPIEQTIARLVVLCIAGGFSYPVLPITSTWNAQNMGGVTKRGISSALIVALGGVAGFTTSYVFPATDAPRYLTGLGLYCGAFCAIIVISIFLRFYFGAQNRFKDEHPRDVSFLSEAEQLDLADKHPDFRYVL